MVSRVERDLSAIAEAHRRFLPKGFEEEVAALEVELDGGRSVLAMRQKGKKVRKDSSIRIRTAILEELSLFLCSDHDRYRDLKESGAELSKESVQFISGVVVGALGVTSGVATGCVAFIALATLRVGIGVFCKLNPPPQQSKVSQKRKKSK